MDQPFTALYNILRLVGPVAVVFQSLACRRPGNPSPHISTSILHTYVHTYVQDSHPCMHTRFYTCVRITMHGTGISLPSLGIHLSHPRMAVIHRQDKGGWKGRKSKTAEPLTLASSAFSLFLFFSFSLFLLLRPSSLSHKSSYRADRPS